MDMALDLLKLIVAGIAGGALSQIIIAHARRNLTAAEVEKLETETSAIEAKLRVTMMKEINDLRQQIQVQATEISELRQRLEECEKFRAGR